MAIDRSEAPAVSVVVPTYNRALMLRDLLNSLAKQTYPMDCFEVIVIDDGSTDDTRAKAAKVRPFAVRYYWQPNQGDAQARNRAAEMSRAEILVFLDDDILVEPDYIMSLVGELGECQNRLVVGTPNALSNNACPTGSLGDDQRGNRSDVESGEVRFTEVFSNSLAIRRRAYFDVGPMDSLGFSGSSMWCDVDFAYRAYLKGFEFRRCGARYYHRDPVSQDLISLAKRMKVASYRAVILLHKYPDLLAHLPMFYDKTPMQWRKDPVSLILRKAVRHLASTRAVLWSMTVVAAFLSQRRSLSAVSSSLHRYIIGGHIFQGFRQGLRDFGSVPQ